MCYYINSGQIKEILPVILSRPCAPCYLKNLDILVLQTKKFDKSIVFPVFVLATLGLFLSVLFLHFKQFDNIVL